MRGEELDRVLILINELPLHDESKFLGDFC